MRPQKPRAIYRSADEQDLATLSANQRKAIEAIKRLKCRLTPSDLATSSGLPINESSFLLNKIAGETGGKLEVAADGTIYYSFARNFTDSYMHKGLKRFLLVVGAVLFNVIYWIIRVSFGVALALSILVIVLIFVALIVLAIAALFGDNSGGGDSGPDFGGGISFIDPTFFFDLFRWDYSPSVTYYPNSVPSNRRDKYSNFVDTNPKGNFFLEVFSFLFGDGDPNSNMEDIRWAQIARTIKENGGVVSTEQLSPFLDGDRSDSGMILSALAQFNGRPEVTKSGYIVYVFPDFLDPRHAPATPPAPPMSYLEEAHWKFSAFSAESVAKVLILAGLNFAGSWWLFKHIATINLLHELALVIDVLLTYAVIFLAIPAIRLLVLLVLNHRIDERNKKRSEAYSLLRSRAADVIEELEEAKQIRLQELQGLRTDRSIVYSSDQDSLEQQFDRQGRPIPGKIQQGGQQQYIQPSLRPDGQGAPPNPTDPGGIIYTSEKEKEEQKFKRRDNQI